MDVVNLDEHYLHLKQQLQEKVVHHNYEDYRFKDDKIVMYRSRDYVPNLEKLRELVMKRIHNAPYVGNPRYQNAIAAVEQKYFCPGMKKDISKYIARFMEYQRVNLSIDIQYDCFN